MHETDWPRKHNPIRTSVSNSTTAQSQYVNADVRFLVLTTDQDGQFVGDSFERLASDILAHVILQIRFRNGGQRGSSKNQPGDR